ncbi:MAG: hypothetical protein V4754_01690 [Pseudomonadota bacterium]
MGRATASQIAAQTVTDKAVRAGRVSAAQVAALTFEAIRDGQFCIDSHPGALDNVRGRMEEIVQQHNPGHPDLSTPRAGQLLRAGMKAATR